MYPGRDFYLEQDLPPNEADLTAGLKLGVVLRALADGDKFLHDMAQARHPFPHHQPGGDRLPAAHPGRLHQGMPGAEPDDAGAASVQSIVQDLVHAP